MRATRCGAKSGSRRQEGKTVCPVLGPGVEKKSDLPKWIGNVYDLAVPERHTTFLREIEADSVAPRVPMMAPEPPENFVRRPKEFDALKAALLDPKGDAVAITAAFSRGGRIRQNHPRPGRSPMMKRF